ncbi:MAG: (Fe-S)-binding protein [Deltaproteobacteria bacterium]|jgi:glycolate oxidase iron-sulfur subunit|nr:(Fe-S)-binding protein [Deltaproteobacteria bacterium]
MTGEHWPAIYERTLDCVHCGLCLQVCPTYRETGRESSSPRGRIYLLRAVAENRAALGEVISHEAYLCLGCRACETACPSGVKFGSMIERARAEIDRSGLRRGWALRLERWTLRGLVANPRRLSLAISLLRVVQRLQLDRLAAGLLPEAWRELSALAPRVPPAAERRPLPAFTPALGEKRGRVALFVGCVMPEFFGAINAATVRVLSRNGFEVVIPESQGCCGALHAHTGDLDFARQLARRNLEAFAAADFDAVILNSAGCGAVLRELREWLGGEGAALSDRVRDVCEFLDTVGLRPPEGRVESTVCYDDPCHLVHGQRVDAAPRRLLEQIPGIELRAHDDPAACCGAAGIYNLTHRAMSRAVLDRKLQSLGAADPDYVASGNPGCLMQLRSGVAAAGLRAAVVHPVELLDRAYASRAVEA